MFEDIWKETRTFVNFLSWEARKSHKNLFDNNLYVQMDLLQELVTFDYIIWIFHLINGRIYHIDLIQI